MSPDEGMGGMMGMGGGEPPEDGGEGAGAKGTPEFATRKEREALCSIGFHALFSK